jgi:hypothetical protein
MNLTEQQFFAALEVRDARPTTQLGQSSESAQPEAAIKTSLASLGHALPALAQPSHG